MKSLLPSPWVHKPFRKNEQGAVLPLVIVVMLLVFSLGGAMLTASALAFKESSDYRNYQVAVLLGKNAVEECRAALAKDVNYLGTKGTRKDPDGSLVKITVPRLASKTKTVTVQVNYKGYRRFYRGTATFSSDDFQTASLVSLTMHLV